MDSLKPPRVIFASDTRGHTAGYHVVTRALRDAGFEVIVTGQQMPPETVAVALQEDADLIALRIMDRDPIELVGALLSELRSHGLDDLPVLIGGIIGPKAQAELRVMGVAGVFGPGSKLSDIADCARRALAKST